MTHTISRLPRREGFTLTELIVAVAIFSIIMTAVMGLFVASMRTVKTGQLAIQSSEEARTAASIIEGDLTSAFAGRDFGEYYQFYGMPIGMTFVGTMRSYDPGSDAKMPNLARTTYAIYAGPGGLKRYTTTWGRINDNDTTVTTDDFREQLEAFVYTCSLIRYYEPNETSLDSFPMNWDSMMQNTEFPAVNEEFMEIQDLANDGWTSDVVAALVQAKKRQLWVRMLSATEQDLPRFWANVDAQGNLLDSNIPPRPNPADYILAEDIEFVEVRMRPNTSAGPPVPDAEYQTDGKGRLFLYLNSDKYTTQTAVDNMALSVLRHGAYDKSLDSTETYRGRDFFQYAISGAKPVMISHWNAEFNVPGFEPFVQGRTDQNPASPVFRFPQDADNAEARPWVGSPIRPRLPEMARVNFTLRRESPAAGAADVFTDVDKAMNIPCGYTRTLHTPEP